MWEITGPERSGAGLSGRAVRVVALTLVAACAVFADFETAGAAASGEHLDDVATISAGSGHTCAVKESGRTVCWGANRDGQLGDGTREDRLAPVPVRGLTGAGEVSAGRAHTCALAGGRVFCWGNNEAGQVGDGSGFDRTVPTAVSGPLSAGSVAAGAAHSCAVDSLGDLRCWGLNLAGQLGDGTVTDRPEPGHVTELNAVESAGAGQMHSCAVAEGGELFCWGLGFSGQLGLGEVSELPVTVPQAVAGLGDVRAVAAGGEHSCALRSGGTVACFGRNDRGQVGNGAAGSEPVASPAAVAGLTDAVSITAGGSHSCAIRESGQAVCWGRNSSGQLGSSEVETGPGARTAAPVDVTGLGDAREISAGEDHTCAIRQSGEVVCWGSNLAGQLGDGTTENRGMPTPVLGGVPGNMPAVPLTVTLTGDGEGTVTSDPAGIECGGACRSEHEAGTVVDLTAEPAAGSRFSGWAGPCSGTGICRVTLDLAVTVTARFDRDGSVPPPPPKGAPRFAPLRLATRPKAVKRGRSGTVTLKVKNTGNAAARGVRICGKGPKGLVRIPKRCIRVGAVRPGATAIARFRVKNVKRKRKPAKAKLTFTATGNGMPAKKGKITVRLK